MFGSQARPGMRGSSSLNLGALGDGGGLFGSRRRPGMAGGLGSLSGSSLGQAEGAPPAEPTPVVTTMTAPAPATPVAQPGLLGSISKPVKVVGLLALAYYIYSKATK